jgi:3-isopropylmalate/(R)-2-methylmalate dehydratase small subunit
MSRPLTLKGKAWVITGKDGKAVDNIDTDMIFHNSLLHITKVEEMGQHSFGNLEGWKDFPKKCQKGDIVVCGKNFGCGSSRQQAIDCFRALGVSCIIAESFGAISKRNAINSGLALVEAPGLFTSGLKFASGDTFDVNMETGQIKIGGKDFKAKPMSEIQKNIFLAGDLFAYGKNLF